MFKKISIFWIIILALLLTSAVPLGVMAFSAIRTTETGVEAEQTNQLSARADAHASTIDEQFRAFETATQLAAAAATRILITQRTELSDQVIQDRLSKYTRDQNGVYGLDNWYTTVYLPQYKDDKQSDVFLNKNTQLTPNIQYDIAATEDLNTLFNAIKVNSPGTQWIYLTTTDGMMRLYPWGPGNSGYAPDWDPRAASFYTVADPTRDPNRISAWTAPYNDAAGAGIMVTNSVPIYDGDKFVAVMSHDFVIKDLQSQVLGFKVGTAGFAFLIDGKGNIVAHKDYPIDPHDATQQDELTIKLVDKDPSMAPVVNAMLSQTEGVQRYKDANGVDWVAVYSNIPSTGWHLGIVQPRTEIIQPALDIQHEVVLGAGGLLIVVLLISVLLARWIALPIRRLSATAEMIEQSVDSDTIAEVQPEGLKHIGGAREIASLVDVFRQMVLALQRHIRELDSIYAMGQTITAHVDFDETLKAVLSSVQRVVDADAAEISILHDDTLVVEAWQGKEGFRNTTARKYRVGEGLTGAIAQNRSVTLVASIESTEMQTTLGYTTPTTELLSKSTKVVIKSFLGIPLLNEGRVIGTLTLVHRDAGHFTENDQRQIAKLSTQASIAIENAITVRQREAVLQNQIKELQIVIDETKKARQIEEIVETDFFRDLRAKANSIRNRQPGAAKIEPTEATPEKPAE